MIRHAFAPIVLLALAGGCGSKLDAKLEKEVSVASPLILEADPASSEQTVKVSVSADTDVYAFACLAKDFDPLEEKFSAWGEKMEVPKTVLWHAVKTKSAEGEVKVPAKEALKVYVISVKDKGKATVKLSNK